MFVFNKYLELEEIAGIRNYFLEVGIQKEYQKDDFFMQQGEMQKYIGCIVKGGFRYLGYTSALKEQIVGYSFENDFVVDYSAFLSQTPAVISGQAIKNSTVLVLSIDEFNRYSNEFSTTNIRSKVAETLLQDIYGRMLSLYCNTPEERYLKIIGRYPDILNQVSLKEIASLVKTTPETLSRIRTKLSHGQNS
ncbi:cAMP-binding domain of CRP or a regulatory subunit of cAMP-dependent protein kinases [Mariniphaga anaerophila]|uniref:cAMP-binding domain of CRP or a regulatory subunit of cAMP-dependent protein kinases n=1 Tax=Mariniphaga anaerophila TaxID=1484053 RepID=A0A1M5CVS8_9BACT|nr:Crp/Fnr family transcriptional regulator [Mariniphaga anaerophila]SHF58870.1 cAMP-binding domain of CRP or a regulatory subunit of cAMP-dependent protein kinases [Mariniphaga anaerophila]